MVSGYVSDAMAAVEASRRHKKRLVEDALDSAWSAVCDLDTKYVSYPYRRAINAALIKIEDLGGMDPALRRADRVAAQAKKIAESE